MAIPSPPLHLLRNRNAKALSGEEFLNPNTRMKCTHATLLIFRKRGAHVTVAPVVVVDRTAGVDIVRVATVVWRAEPRIAVARAKGTVGIAFRILHRKQKTLYLGFFFHLRSDIIDYLLIHIFAAHYLCACSPAPFPLFLFFVDLEYARLERAITFSQQ